VAFEREEDLLRLPLTVWFFGPSIPKAVLFLPDPQLTNKIPIVSDRNKAMAILFNFIKHQSAIKNFHCTQAIALLRL